MDGARLHPLLVAFLQLAAVKRLCNVHRGASLFSSALAAAGQEGVVGLLVTGVRGVPCQLDPDLMTPTASIMPEDATRPLL